MLQEFLIILIPFLALQIIGVGLFFKALDSDVILFHIPAESNNLNLFGKIVFTLLLCCIFPLTFIFYLSTILLMAISLLLKRLFFKTEINKGGN